MSEPTPEKEFMTLQEVADLFGVSIWTARNWGYAKVFPVIDMGHRTKRVPSESIRELIKRRTRIAVKGR